MKNDFRSCMYLFEQEVILVGDTEPTSCMYLCVFEDNHETVDYGGSPISWLEVDWEATNKLWEENGLLPVEECSYEDMARVEWNGSNWVLESIEEF